MKIRLSQLRSIIKEEVGRIVLEARPKRRRVDRKASRADRAGRFEIVKWDSTWSPADDYDRPPAPRKVGTKKYATYEEAVAARNKYVQDSIGVDDEDWQSFLDSENLNGDEEVIDDGNTSFAIKDLDPSAGPIKRKRARPKKSKKPTVREPDPWYKTMDLTSSNGRAIVRVVPKSPLAKKAVEENGEWAFNNAPIGEDKYFPGATPGDLKLSEGDKVPLYAFAKADLIISILGRPENIYVKRYYELEKLDRLENDGYIKKKDLRPKHSVSGYEFEMGTMNGETVVVERSWSSGGGDGADVYKAGP